MAKYTFRLKPRELGTVTWHWDKECTTEEEWRELSDRMNDYVQRSNKIRDTKQTMTIIDWSQPREYIAWQQLQPTQPTQPRRPIIFRRKYNGET